MVAYVSLAGNVKNQYFMTCHILESSVMFYPQMLKLFDSSKVEGSKTEQKSFLLVSHRQKNLTGNSLQQAIKTHWSLITEKILLRGA